MDKNQVDLTEARKYLVSLTLQAGEMLIKYFNSRDFAQHGKGGVDFTTQADEEVDKFLRVKIGAKYPGSDFLTEETAPKDYSNFKGKRSLWVIDPLDGTASFSRKHPNFAISIALVEKDVPKLGVVHVPMKGKTYWAQEDEDGAYLNGKTIQVSTTSELGKAVLALDWSWDIKKRLDVASWITKLCTKARQIRLMGSAASDLSSLAEGDVDAYLHSGLKPWDTAACSLIIEKAGGTITNSKGKKWDVFQPDIIASNGILHGEILKTIN